MSNVAKTRVFRATLKGVRGERVRRKVWRELAVPDRADLYRLGKGVVEAFGLFFDHAFGFYDDLEDPYHARRQYELFVDLEREEGGAEAEALEQALFKALLRFDLADRVGWIEALAGASAAFFAERLEDLEKAERKRAEAILRERFREGFLALLGPAGPAEVLALGRQGKAGVRGVPVSRVFKTPGDKMAMIFDYGDEWIFEVEYLGPGERKKSEPWVRKGQGSPPPQYPGED